MCADGLLLDDGIFARRRCKRPRHDWRVSAFGWICERRRLSRVAGVSMADPVGWVPRWRCAWGRLGLAGMPEGIASPKIR